MPRRTQGETRAMKDSYHSMGLMSISDYAWLGENLAHREVIDGALRGHGLPRSQIDLPTAPASDLSAPSTVVEAEISDHADIWLRSRAREFSGLQQAHTFGPA